MNASKYIELAPGLIICRAVTGLWQIADLERDGKRLDAEKSAEAMHAYAKAGFTTFDMADHYGSAEEIAGVFQTRYAKEKTQLLTKWVPTPGILTRQQVREAVERALERLQLQQIDLMQFHTWSYAHPSWVDALIWLHELRGEGLIKHIGLTNFDSAHLNLVVSSGIEVVSNQVCYSLLDQRAAGRMTEICRKHKVKLLAFGTVAGGFLSEKWLNKKEPALNDSLTWSQMKYKRFIDTAGGWEVFQSLLNTLDRVATEHEVGIATIVSKYILEQPAVGGVIIGARLGQSEHIAENEKLFSFELDDNSKKRITNALAMLQPIPGDCGDEYRKPPFLTASGDLSHHVESFPAPYPGVQGGDGRTKALSGTVWEGLTGFSRAVRKGNRILVSGTTATHGSRAMGGNDPAAQTHFIIDKIEGAIQSLGGTLNDVVRTRIFIRNINDWESIARAHGERFKDIQPANTMVKAELIGDEYLVEMEAEAMISENTLK
jgi:aryl-alcohol dehydrogenase-like predicted oxidoreductase